MSSHGWAEGEGKGGVRVYEAYEVKKRRKITLSLTSPHLFLFFSVMKCLRSKKTKKLCYITTVVWHVGSCFSAACDASSRLGHSNECSIYVL